MLLKLLLSILLITPVLSNCQTYEDSLKKYSYHIFGFSIPKILHDSSVLPINVTGGSGFFIRKNGSLFLITAKHVLSGCSDSSIKDVEHPNNMIIWLSEDNEFNFISLNISVIKDTASCLPFRMSPDEIVVIITDTTAKNVYSVENFIQPPFKKIKNSIIIGYPGIGNLTTSPLHYIHPSIIDMKENSYSIGYYFTDSSLKYVDSINYYVFVKKMKIDNSLRGYSGSPFFVQDFKSKKWRIAGILCGAGSDANHKLHITAVKIEYAISDINNMH